MPIREYLFDLAKIVDGAANADHDKVVAYGEQLSRRLRDDGEGGAAKRLDQIISKSRARRLSLARSTSGGVMNLPVDSESRLAVADEEHWSKGEVELHLPNEIQQHVDRFLRCFNAADELMASGVGVTASMLVYGPPGCGKTQLARFVAAQLDLPLLTARADALISSYLGSTAKNIRSLFEHAASRPCVLFLDEFDALAKMRDDSRELGELKRVVISLLQNIDALGHDHVLIAATNHEHLLDPAIWRRFACRLRISEPDLEGRLKLLQLFLGDFANEMQVHAFASVSDGASGATLRQISEDAIRDCILDGTRAVSTPRVLRDLIAQSSPESEGVARDQVIRELYQRNPKYFTQSTLGEIFDLTQSRVSRIINV